MIYLILILGGGFFLSLIGFMLPSTQSKTANVSIGVVISFMILAGVYIILDKYNLLNYLAIASITTVIVPFLVALLVQKGVKVIVKDENGIKPFVLYGEKGFKLTFDNPFLSFLIYGGMGAGKTASVGKPLLKQYMENNFAMFIYDLKDGDYSRSAYYLSTVLDYKPKFYGIDFGDMDKTYRFNAVKPSVIKDVALMPQLTTDLLYAYKNAKGKTPENEFFFAGLGVLKAVSVRFFNDFPEHCTIPHIFLYLVHNAQEPEKVTNFINADPQAKALASGYLSSAGSPKTQASYISSLTTYIGDLAFNKNVCYVLSGDDFDFNLVDPKEPKLFAISNKFQLQDIISPIISTLVKISSRHLTIHNKIPLCYFMDEATTFRIDDFENMPSVLREYLVSFVFMTQSSSKIVKLYGREDLASIEANYGNIFLGRTKDPTAQKNYVQLFEKIDKKMDSYSRNASDKGSSRGSSYRIERKDKYEPAFFSTLKSGQFVGSTASANQKEFNARFTQFQQPDNIELPTIRKVTQEMIDKNYQSIIDFVKSIE